MSVVAADYDLQEGAGGDVERTLSDSLVMTDAQTRTGWSVRQLTDAFSLADVSDAEILRYAIVYERTLSDSLSTSDGLKPYLERMRVLPDNLSIADTAARNVSLVRALTDAAILTDNLISEILGTGGVLVRTLADAIILADGMIREGRSVRQLVDALSVSGLVKTSLERMRSGQDAFAMTDAEYRVLERTPASELLDVLDTLDRGALLTRTIADELGLSDAYTATLIQALRERVLSDSLVVTDSSVAEIIRVMQAVGLILYGVEKMNILLGVDDGAPIDLGVNRG